MFVKVNGAKLFFDVDGEGLTPSGTTMQKKPTVVMVHGGPGADHSVSKPYFSQLTDVAQVVYYDHRGNGRSDISNNASWNLAQWGDDLKGLCDALGIENPIVVGTSFGGFVTLSYAVRHPGHAVGLVLISTAAKVDFQSIYNAFERFGGKEVRDIAEEYWENPTAEGRMSYREHCVPFYRKNKFASNDWMSRILCKNETALWFNGPHNEHGRMDFRAALPKIRCPVLVMVGEDDPITPPKFSDEIVNGLGAEQVIYKKFQNCAHGVVGDKPDAALKAIRHFICSLPVESYR
ncbi:MAG: alpha/beta hydrolase [Cyanobacteria bacterium P01_H01_bin.153]